jgi:hypothetical protein
MKHLFWFFIFLTLFGCRNKSSSFNPNSHRPDSLLSRSQMVRIITDMQLTEAALTYLKNKGEQNQDISELYYNAVFSKYKISKKNFDSNFDYYKSDQEGFIKMYEDVIQNLEILKKQGQSKAVKEE